MGKIPIARHAIYLKKKKKKGKQNIFKKKILKTLKDK